MRERVTGATVDAVGRSALFPGKDGTARRRALALVLMIASGFAGLGDEIVWTQQSALWIGHEAAAVLAVLTAFFGGLAVGALATGSRIARSARPLRWYVACEATIAVWAVALVGLLPPASEALLRITGPQPAASWQWTVAFVGTFLLLLPATAAMGATLPAIERLVSQLHASGRSIAGLYAANTFGAVLGVLAAAFWLVPWLGLSRTALVCAALNALCAACAPRLLERRSATVDATGTRSTPLPWRLFATGLLGIGYEVLVVRVLGQVCEDTVYTVALVLAVYLVGTAAGAAAYQRWSSHRRAIDDDRALDRLLCALAFGGLLGMSTLWFADAVRVAVVDALGSSMASALAAEATLAMLAFALPTVAMGALFSHLAATAHASGTSFGRVLGINIAGATIAPLLFGIVIAPLLGAKAALLAVVAGYLLLVEPKSWRRASVVVPTAVLLVVAAWAPPLVFVDVPEGGRVVSYREGVMAAVSVVEDDEGVMRLRIDNRQQEGSSATGLVDGRQALLPVLLHPAPQRVLFLGLGTGVTAATAAEDPTLSVDAVELVPEVVDASRSFVAASRLHPVVADARRFVRTSASRYDVIVADNFHPARSGSGALYTVEHFVHIRNRLADDGLFCQWLPLHQLDLETLRSIVRSFLSAYPDGYAMLASNSLATPVIGLVGRREGGRFEGSRVRDRLERSNFPRGPATFGLEDEYALLGSFFAGPRALSRFAGDADANTDDRPVVAYRAPRITYVPQSTPQDRLVALLAATSVAPGELVADGAFADRLAAYRAARDRYIDLGRGITPSSDVRTMLSQVGAPLLDVLRTSPDFRPAYDPLLRMGVALARVDPTAGRDLLARLVERQPARAEARDALARLFAPATGEAAPGTAR